MQLGGRGVLEIVGWVVDGGEEGGASKEDLKVDGKGMGFWAGSHNDGCLEEFPA